MNRKQRQQNGNGSTSVAMAGAPTPSIRPAGPERAGEPASSQGGQGRNAAPRQPASPTLEEIRIRAYEFYLARNGRNGTPEGDWIQAERDLRERAGRFAV
jgi:hypothetical protein